MAPVARKSDDYDDLAGVDLARLDLDHIDLADEPRSPWWTRLLTLLLFGLGALVLWVPSTEYYRMRGDGSPLFVVLGVAGIGTGLLLSRVLWRWAEEAAAAYAARRRLERPEP